MLCQHYLGPELNAELALLIVSGAILLGYDEMEPRAAVFHAGSLDAPVTRKIRSVRINVDHNSYIVW